MEGPRPAAIAGAGGRNTLHPLICAAIVAAAAVLAYLNSFQGAFQLDDYKVVLSDPAVRSWGGWWSDLGRGIRPLLKLSYALNWATGLGLFGFHLANLLIHLGNSILVLLLARKLTGSSSRMCCVALFTALLFALHPIQTEAVTYVAGRSASLMAFFYLASLTAYIHGRLEGRPLLTYALSPALFLLALAVKETAATLPAALLLWEITRQDRPFGLREALASQAAHLGVLAAALAAFFAIPGHRVLIDYSFALRGLYENLLSQIHGQVTLLTHDVLPGRLNFDPDLPTLTRWSWGLALEAGILGSALAAGLWSLQRRPLVAFAILWVFLHSMAVYAAVPRTDILNERHLYLGGFGLFLLAGAGVEWFADQWPTLRLPVAAAACALLIVLGLFTAERNAVYRSEICLWEDTAAKSPGKARVFNNLGYACFLAGRNEEARKAWLETLRIDPAHELARNNLTLLDVKGDAL
ncbi:MAG TPA: tetratricopeptide repeat protein [Syntrophales bacterium]